MLVNILFPPFSWNTPFSSTEASSIWLADTQVFSSAGIPEIITSMKSSPYSSNLL